MKAMILAAGLGTRLRPMTWSIPKPMVPVLSRPVMSHIARLLARNELTEVVANLHYFPDTIRDYFGDGSSHGISLTYSYEEELMGTAGGVRNVADFFGDEPFLVISGDALTDLDLSAMQAFHESHDGIATLAAKQVDHTEEYGVIVHGGDGRIEGFQEKPDPDEALSDLANCGIYMFDPAIFDYFPEDEFVDWAKDVFPALFDNDVPFYVHSLDGYWNDVGSLDEYREGSFDLASGALDLEIDAREQAEGLRVGDGTTVPDDIELDGTAYIGANCTIGAEVRIDGPVVIGDDCEIADGAMLRDTIIWPGRRVAEGEVVIGGILAAADVTPHLAGRAEA